MNPHAATPPAHNAHPAGYHVTPERDDDDDGSLALDPQHGGHGAHGHGHGHDEEESHSTFKGYATGFILSVILTAIPFWLVMAKVFDKPATTAMVVLGFAAVQIVVHMVYFLHMNVRVQGGWTMLALIFTLVLVVITLSGSLWVMFHLNHNMMPTTVHDMQNMP